MDLSQTTMSSLNTENIRVYSESLNIFIHGWVESIAELAKWCIHYIIKHLSLRLWGRCLKD